MKNLLQNRQSVPFLQEQLKEIWDHEANKQLAAWIDCFDVPAFEERERAMKALAEMGQKAEPALRRELRAKPSLEAHTRIDQLLDGLKEEKGTKPSPETERNLRAVEVLERIDSPESRNFFKTLADQGLLVSVAEEAAEALERLRNRTMEER